MAKLAGRIVTRDAPQQSNGQRDCLWKHVGRVRTKASTEVSSLYFSEVGVQNGEY